MSLRSNGARFLTNPSTGYTPKNDSGLCAILSFRGLILILAMCFVIGMSLQALADEPELVTVNWQDPPADILPEAELEKIRQLNQIWNIQFETELNPAGDTVALRAVHPEEETLKGFWNFVDHNKGFVTSELLDMPVVETAWADENYLVSILEDENDETLFMAGTNKNNGRTFVEDNPLPVSGNVLALSPDASKLLVLAPHDRAQLQKQGEKRESSKVRTITISGKMAAFDEQDGQQITVEDSVLLLVDLNSMDVHELTVFDTASVIPTASFSPDGKNLAVVHNYMGEEIESIVRKDRNVESLTQVQVQEALGLVEPEENPLHTNSSILFFDIQSLENPQPKIMEARNTPGFYPRFPSNSKPVWSPSGDLVVLMTQHPAVLKGREKPVYIKTASSSYLIVDNELNIHNVIDSPPFNYPGQIPDINWLSTHELIFELIDGLDMAVYHYDINRGSQARLYNRGYIRSSLILPDNRSMFMVVSSADQAPELLSLNLDSGEAVHLTEMNTQISLAAGVAVHPVEFTLESGKVRKGYWFAPENMQWPPRNERLAFWQAGGPGGPMVNAWSYIVEYPLTLLPALDISVLMVPLQERPGWNSENWTELAQGQNFGKVDIDELAEIAIQLKTRGWVSDKGAGITGCSYGGYMTSQSIVRHPEIWDAAVTQCSLLDLHTEFQMGYASHIAYLMGSVPWMARDHYYQASPGFHGSSVTTPTLVFHGVDDFLPVGIAQNFFYDIHSAGTPARMLRFLDEQHGISKDPNKIYAAQEQIQWFRKYLQ